MLFVVGADAAIVGAAVFSLGMRLFGIFGGLVIIPYLFIIGNVIGYQDLLETVSLTGFGDEHVGSLKNDLGIDLAVAYVAQADGMVVINVIAFIAHSKSVLMD